MFSRENRRPALRKFYQMTIKPDYLDGLVTDLSGNRDKLSQVDKPFWTYWWAYAASGRLFPPYGRTALSLYSIWYSICTVLFIYDNPFPHLTTKKGIKTFIEYYLQYCFWQIVCHVIFIFYLCASSLKITDEAMRITPAVLHMFNSSMVIPK